MGSKSKIQWTDATWSPVRGCSMVSPGCTNCYAMTQAHRWPQFGKLTRPSSRGMVWTGEVNPIEALLPTILSWREPRFVFVNSQSDTFHENVPDDFIDRMFAVMSLCPQHIFQVLTKRPARMLEYFTQDSGYGRWGYIEGRARRMHMNIYGRPMPSNTTLAGAAPLKNVWLGVSVEDQERADERIPLLLRTPAALRFLSCEPLLGPLDLSVWIGDQQANVIDRRRAGLGYVRQFLHWAIVGGESGRNARSTDLQWIRSLIQQGSDADLPIFVKQIGAVPIDTHPKRPELFRKLRPRRDRKGADPLEWPPDLRVRQFPEVPA